MLGFNNFDELARRNLEQKGYETDSPRSKFRNQIEKSDVIIGFESKWTKKDGTSIDISESAITIRGANGNVLYYDGTVEDITERKRAEKELIIAKDRAEEMSRLKSNFLANMSHELRTPLIGINGFADFLRNDIEDPELKQMAENICISGSRLSETLNLILDLSKLESGKMDFTHKRINLVNQTEELISVFKEAARKKGLYLETSFNKPSIFINTDEQAFRSILNNLINNAIKFTNEGGIATDISLKDNFVEIKVTDSGIGIAKENQDMIFEEFRQVSEGRSRNFEGTGLGLSITKTLVEKVGGEIIVNSEPDKGSTFIVKLPVTSVEEKIEEKIAIEKAPPTVLIEQKLVKSLALSVDDDPFVYLVLERFLDGLADLENTPDGEVAVKMCMQKQYDYIFMDINLGRGMDGKQVAQAIRKIKGYESIPIIATTGYAMVGDKEEFLAAGCSHYLSKPFDKQDILNLLEEIQSGR
jgi:signal transduction histidine kinase/ActR/RegA family two-component response regulator